ncbi:uncharacterized protein PSFLO_00931 [Pseudozyma flocculosa]|uniref:Uncharacterized protein n=1 Tax=Pseudozyma flocculosa TaxID=84751 RepID=A0A5C3EUC2_9BASI|nr:uncharacterized protein PSFLO_00931 [Pseudozyma flocculosa]
MAVVAVREGATSHRNAADALRLWHHEARALAVTWAGVQGNRCPLPSARHRSSRTTAARLPSGGREATTARRHHCAGAAADTAALDLAGGFDGGGGGEAGWRKGVGLPARPLLPTTTTTTTIATTATNSPQRDRLHLDNLNVALVARSSAVLQPAHARRDTGKHQDDVRCSMVDR